MSRRSQQIVCDDCGRRRDPERAVRRNTDGSVAWICRRCDRDREYLTFLGEWTEMDARVAREVAKL